MEKLKNFLPLIIGVALIAGGVFMYFRTGELVKNCTEKATATVVDMREEMDTSSETIRYIYRPVISYQAGGQTLEKELSTTSNTPAYRIGETLEILYNPNKVDEFLVSGENQNFTWILLSALGIIFLAGGIYVLVKR